MPTISIILPVYNAEKFLPRVLNSLIRQSFSDVEILCINDGSTDKSSTILSQFAQTDTRVKVFSQENAGPGAARNVGLANATGKYIMFCDSDDFYEATMCEEMLVCIEEKDVDMVICDVNIREESSGHMRTQAQIQEIYLSVIGEFELTDLTRSKIFTTLWNIIFKTDIVRNYEIKFPTQGTLDDLEFIYKYVSVAKRAYGLPSKLYNYFLNPNSYIEKAIVRGDMATWFITSIYNTLLFLEDNNKLENKNWLLERLEKIITDFKLTESEIEQRIADTIQSSLSYFDNEIISNYLYCSKLIKFVVEPKFNDNDIAIVFATDDNYMPYLGVALFSLVQNRCKHSKYDISILYNSKLSKTSKQNIKCLERENVSIRFIPIDAYLNDLKQDVLHVCAHFSIAAYFRVFIPEIFTKFKFCIYLDCDVILMDNILEILKNDSCNYIYSAVIDSTVVKFSQDKFFTDYIEETLGMKNKNEYVNSGVSIFNIEKMLSFNFREKFMNNLCKIKTPIFVDQCVINATLDGLVYFLPQTWNYLMNSDENLYKLSCCLGEEEGISYLDNKKMPKLLHYCSDEKPWANPNCVYGYIWWEYARKSIFYETILYKNIKTNTIAQDYSKEITLVENSLLHKMKNWCNKNLNNNNLSYKTLRKSYIAFRAIWRNIKALLGR